MPTTKTPYNVILALFVACTLCVSGCMPSAGPGRVRVLQAAKPNKPEGIVLKKVDDQMARKLAAYKAFTPFTDVFGSSPAPRYIIGPGDIIEVAIWETAPSLLFGGAASITDGQAPTAHAETLPPQMVMEDGRIRIPFAGRIKVAGRTLQSIENSIVERLEGKANNPQVMVRLSGNYASQVAVLGDVAKSTNIALTPRKERLLDALATAGGVSQPVTKVSLQLTRSGTTASMPLNLIIKDPMQNIPLLPGDVLTAMFQPWTFSALGATGKNTEIPFEAQGITLAQALARSGGLNYNRADPGGVFLFRFEDRKALEAISDNAPESPDSLIPVIYQIDFNNPSAFFATQHFPMQDKDVLYVATAPAAELEKFLRMIGMVLTPALNLGRYQLSVQTAD